MRVVRTIPLALIAVLLAGCATGPASNISFATAPPSGRIPYAGSLTTSPTPATSLRSFDRTGAAGDVVDCSGRPTGGSSRPGTRQSSSDSPQAAVDREVASELPVATLALERDDGDRVLFTTSYGGRARQAVIVRRADPASDAAASDGKGWYVESYAWCDLADFPEAVSAAAGVEIWSDAAGVRQPTTVISSGRGPEHCGEEHITFLTLGTAVEARANPYLDAIPSGMEADFAVRPQPHVAVPSDAVDTGFTRAGEHLWLSSDRTRAYVGTRTDAALWPQAIEAFGCA